MKKRLSLKHTRKTYELFSNIMLPNELESEVSRFITHVQFISATILVSFNFLSVMSLVSSYQRKTRIFIFTFLLFCPCNQSLARSKRNSDGVELPLRHMKYYKTSATLMELIEGPTTDNRPMCQQQPSQTNHRQPTRLFWRFVTGTLRSIG